MLDNGMVRVATWVERSAITALWIGREATVMMLPIWIGYLCLGAALKVAGIVSFPYPFLSLKADPLFNLISFLIGIALLAFSCGLIVLQMLQDIHSPNDQLSFLLAGIALGSAIAVLRFTYETALGALMNVLPWLMDFI